MKRFLILSLVGLVVAAVAGMGLAEQQWWGRGRYHETIESAHWPEDANAPAWEHANRPGDRRWGGSIRRGQMRGGRMWGGHMHGGQMWGGLMCEGHMHGGHMHGGQMHGGQTHGGQMHGGQMHGGHMHGGQMHGGQTHGGQMHGGQMHGGQTHGGQMRGGRMHGGQMRGGRKGIGRMRGKAFRAGFKRLKSIREMAAEEGATKTVEALDELIAKRKQRSRRGMKHKQPWFREQAGDDDSEEAEGKHIGHGKYRGRARRAEPEPETGG